MFFFNCFISNQFYLFPPYGAGGGNILHYHVVTYLVDISWTYEHSCLYVLSILHSCLNFRSQFEGEVSMIKVSSPGGAWPPYSPRRGVAPGLVRCMATLYNYIDIVNHLTYMYCTLYFNKTHWMVNSYLYLRDSSLHQR